MQHRPRGARRAAPCAATASTASKIYLYGEGWNFGEVADDARFVQATQRNMAGTGIGTFSDRLRDAVRGGGPLRRGPAESRASAPGSVTDPNGAAANGTAAEQRARLLHYEDLVKLGPGRQPARLLVPRPPPARR